MRDQMRIETLRAVLKESQQVKANLENKLCEQRKKRREKESELSTVNGKLAQTKVLSAKTREAKDISQCKTDNSQKQADGLEKEIKRKRDLLKKIEDDIAKYKENRSTEVEKFEEELNALSKQFKLAKKEYTETILLEKIKDAEAQCEETLIKVEKAKEDEVNINTANYLKSLQMEQPVDRYGDVEKDLIGNITTEERSRLETEFVNITQELQVAQGN